MILNKMTTLNKMGRIVVRNTSSVRKDISVSLREMERLTGVSRSTLARIERAKVERRTYNPMFATVVKLAASAGVSVDEYTQTLV
jgi:transcriptional regulator with XRE-family HTH domain